MKHFLFLSLGISFSLAFTYCKSGENEISDEAKADTVSLLGDRSFRNGLSLKGTSSAHSPTGKYLSPFGKAQINSVWELAEWESKYQLSQDMMETDGDTRIYRDPGKMISFRESDGDYHIRMDVISSNEYTAPRKAGEGWPHLLLEQSFPEKVLLKDLKGLLLGFSGRLVGAEMKMPADRFDKGLHSAQFQLFITAQDLNPQSPGYGDYLWFGIPFYDYRYREAEVYAAKDIGKDDATGKFIYSLANRDFMKGSFHDGEWITISKDLLPEIKKAIGIARERGYLKQSAEEDLRISGMNIGWEVPGTFDVAFEFKGFNISAVR